ARPCSKNSPASWKAITFPKEPFASRSTSHFPWRSSKSSPRLGWFRTKKKNCGKSAVTLPGVEPEDDPLVTDARTARRTQIKQNREEAPSGTGAFVTSSGPGGDAIVKRSP